MPMKPSHGGKANISRESALELQMSVRFRRARTAVFDGHSNAQGSDFEWHFLPIAATRPLRTVVSAHDDGRFGDTTVDVADFEGVTT